MTAETASLSDIRAYLHDSVAPNRKCIADFTYVWTAEGWLYVAAVVDLFSRVVGWSMSTTMTAQFVTDALVMAIWRRGKPDALLHHSDRGSQYTSEQFQRLMSDNGVVCSMSRSGNVRDSEAYCAVLTGPKMAEWASLIPPYGFTASRRRRGCSRVRGSSARPPDAAARRARQPPSQG